MMMTWLAPAAAFGALFAAVLAVEASPFTPALSLVFPIAGSAFAIVLASIYLIRSARRHASTRTGDDTPSTFPAAANIAAIVMSAAMLGVLYMRATVVDQYCEQQYTYFHNIAYEVTSEAPTAVSVAYSMYNPRQRLPVTDRIDTVTPWQQAATTASGGSRATLTVRLGEQGGSVTCKIIVDGVPHDTHHASGSHGIAHCSVTVHRP
jgi:hypothetical protein